MAPAISTPDFLADFRARGLVHQATAEADLAELLCTPQSAYVGFDPTADSLHVGSLLPLLALVRLQRAGHRAIALVGGGTGLIGDPSGKASERVMLSKERLEHNRDRLRAQLERFLDFDGPRGALLLDNSAWLCQLKLLDFLRDIGKHFSVGAMVQRDAVQLRLQSREHGLSYTEFSYALLQAYDFLELYDRHGCRLQLGGSDQWGNIVDGCDLVRRLRSVAVHGLTMPLLTKSDGSKFGKSEAGNVWLDARLTRPFHFYQFWLNSEDADVGRLLRYFTFLEPARLAELDEALRGRPEKREAQRALAAEVTTLVHGSAASTSAERASTVLFEGGDLRSLAADELEDALSGSPRLALAAERLDSAQADLEALLVESGLSPSKGQARQALRSGAVSVNQTVERDPRRLTRADVIAGRYIVLRRGKKTYCVVDLKA